MANSIFELINEICSSPDCEVYPPNGLPVIGANHILPRDVEEFYRLCGGIDLFKGSAFPTTISMPQRLVLANPVIFKNVSAEDIAATKEDISWSWYLIGEGANSQYMTIDLNPIRLGLCYNSLWILHPGNSDIIALSFTDLLRGLVATNGDYYYWDTAEFQSLGSPYNY